MGWVDAILITALDLINSHENSKKYVVVLLAHTDTISTDSQTGKFEKLFQITKVERLEAENAAPGLLQVGEQMDGVLKDLPARPDTRNIRTVRAMWVSESSSLSCVYFARHVNQPMLDFVANKRMPGPGSFGPPLVPVSKEWLIR